MSNLSNKGSNGIDVVKAIDFLKLLWQYESIDATCFSIVIIGEKTRYKLFCLSENEGYYDLFIKIREYLSSITLSERDSVYFQILPLCRKPEKGRGSSKDVKVGKWLWVDLDYKMVVDKAEFLGCREYNDHSIECYYQEGDKYVYVNRPPLTYVINDIYEKIATKPTLVVDSGAGYHIYFKLMFEIDSSKLNRLESKLVDKLGGDPQSKDLSRILRLPGSINPRVNRKCEVIYHDNVELDPDKLGETLEKTFTQPLERALRKPETMRGEESPPRKEVKLRSLSDTEILKIIELLKESYKPGYRQYLVLFLSGWLAKAGIDPVTAVKIVKALYEMGDNDPLKMRLGAVVYSYKKCGVKIDDYADEIEKLMGVKPYGVEREIEEDKVKGISGLQEILEKTVGEDRSLAIIHEISEILNTLSPYQDSIVELLDYEKQIYALSNLRKQVIVRAKKDGDRLVYKERIAVVCPTRVVVYRNPIGGITKYEVVFEGKTLDKPLIIGPATIDEIAERLALEGLVYCRRLLIDVLSSIIQAYIRKNRAEVRTEIESPGYYLLDNKIVSVKTPDNNVDPDKLREALALLDELGENWFKHVQERFSTIIKWGIIAPFSYILKQRGKWLPWLYLYGDSGTGKTTMGRIVLKIWGLDSRNEKTGANIDTIPRLGYVLSQSTYPVLVNEPGGALIKEEIVETIKNAIDNTIVRGKYYKGSYIEIPALAPLIFTSNKHIPQDDALLRRIKTITFSFGEKIPIEKQREFQEKIEPRLNTLSEIGKCVAKQVVENGLDDTGNIFDLSKTLLAKCYEMVGKNPPNWLSLEYSEIIDLQSNIVEEFTEKLKKYINDLFSKHVSKIVETNTDTLRANILNPESIEITRKLKILLEKYLIPGMRIVENNEVIIMRTLLDEIGMGEKISLKSLAEILGWKYGVYKVNRQNVKGIRTTMGDIIALITNVQ